MNVFTDDRHSYSICLIGHGSRDSLATQEFLTLCKKLRKKILYKTIECGFLEFAKPTAVEALYACRRDGVKNIIILPGILFPGKHTQRDVPNTVDKVFQNCPNINLIFTKPLATHPILMEACRKLIEEEEKISPKFIPRSESLLMTIGHGSQNKDFNCQVEKNLYNLGEKLGFGKTLTFFAGLPQHSIGDIEKNFTPQGFRRVILFPFFLFTGVWVKRINTLSKIFQTKHVDTEFLKASCLNHNDLIVDALIQRIIESVAKK
jgi:sirohydrochlorin cobaltochelatase